MQSNQLSYSIRKYLIPKIMNHKNTHNLTTILYQQYCKITSKFHVLPDFYIIGGQKCGTTSLFMYLSEHNLIHSAVAKDIRFFDKYFEKGIDWYRVYFPQSIQKCFVKNIMKENFLTCDATERYLDHPHAPKRIQKCTPNAKFIILLRNPIDRAYSHYTMINNRGGGNSPFGDKLSFEEAIEKEEERIEGQLEKMLTDPNYYSDIYFRHSYLQRGIYVDKLERWFSVFPKEQFLIIQSEEFFKHTSKMYKEVLEFLDLSNWEPNEYVQYKKREYKQPKMNPETRKKLVEYFKPHNERLYEFLGRRFDWDE